MYVAMVALHFFQLLKSRGLSILTVITPRHFSAQVYACNVEIACLSRAGKIEDARQLFDQMPTKDVVSWNAIITAYWQNGLFRESKRLFELIPVKNTVSWNSMIAGFNENGMVDDAFQYFKQMPKRNIVSWNAMISGFIRSDRFQDANRLFEEMPARNVISYTAMIDGYMKIKDFGKARELFDSMPQRNVVSWNVIIKGYVENGRFEEARLLYEQMPIKDVCSMTSIITGYFKEGMIEEARLLFEAIKRKDSVSWNAMISGYALNGVYVEALKLYSQMLGIGMKPDHLTFVSLFTACSGLAMLKCGRQTHVLVIKNGFVSDLSVSNALATMYSRCGNIAGSESVFNQIDNPDLVSWNTIISAFAQHGDYERALALFNDMRVKAIEPDGITFLSLLSVCNHSGKVDESMNLLDLMVKGYNIPCRDEHYSCLVDILCRAGRLPKACKVIQEMPFEASVSVWGALLAACSVYLNVDLGELAAKKLLDLDPLNSGTYVLLSNIYAKAGMWKEVSKVRVLMKEQGVEKQRAYSWLEIGDKLQFFVGGDACHSDIVEIHRELKRLRIQLKSVDEIENCLFE